MTGGGRKAKGSRRERELKNKLEAGGWFVVKAGGSLGAFDLIAFSGLGYTLFIQVKSNRKPPPAEMREMYRVACKLGTANGRMYQVWVKKDREADWLVLDLMTEGPKYGPKA